MSIAPRSRAAPFVLTAIGFAACVGFVSPGQALAQPSIRWIGQDGHDFVGLRDKPGKSDIQDLHFVMSGLSPRVKLASAIVKGDGDGEWKYNGPPNSWLALFAARATGGAVDIWLEPYRPDPGRGYDFHLTFDDGRKVVVSCRGGKADPNLRMPGTGIEVRWIGQDKQDRCGPNQNPGPDGLQDVHLALTKLSPKEEIQSIQIIGHDQAKWQYLRNPEGHPSAEFVKHPADPTRGDLFFQPLRDLSSKPMTVVVTYANKLTDAATIKASKTDSALKMPVIAAPSVETLAIQAQWLGQEPSGDVRVSLKGLPRSGRLASISLSDGVVGGWSDKPAGGDFPPLSLRPGGAESTAELRFSPVRDESGSVMTIVFQFADRKVATGQFPGGYCDPSLRAPAPAGTTTRVRPGDDLHTIVSRFGTVFLEDGEYPLNKPLVLDKPVTITSNGGATLVFSQASTEPRWTTAIKIHSGRTTLDRLKIRFATAIRWDDEVSFGPSIIGTTDSRDRQTGNLLAGLTFTHLDVQGPPATTAWEEAPRILRLLGATNGVVEENVFKGGLQELFGGPWRYVGNRYDGTPANQFTYAVASFHAPHDVTVAKNRVKPVEKSAKTWRWLVLTGRGDNVRVSENVTEGVGARDDDTHEHPNATETIITESYRLTFEGKTTSTSSDGRVVSVAMLQGTPARVGSVLAILSGPQAGQWRKIVWPLNAHTFLLDKPVALGGGAISISEGFTDTRFDKNSIDARGSKIARPFVLCGQHFGTIIAQNHTLGGHESFMIFASGSEAPVYWGWSHNPMFGLVFDRNTFEDAWDGALLGVHNETPIRWTQGRVYMTATLQNNTFIWSDAFLSAFSKAKGGAAPLAIKVGWKPSGNPGEFIVNEHGNTREGGAPGPSMRIHMTTLNGETIKDALAAFSTDTKPTAGGRTNPTPSRR